MRINIWGTFKLIKWWRWHCRLQWIRRSKIGDDFLFEITWKFLPDFGVILIWTSFSVEGLRTDNLDFLFTDTVWFSGGSNFLLFIQQLLTCYPCLTLVARPLILQEPPPLLGHLCNCEHSAASLLLFPVDGLLRQTASELYNEGDKSPSKYRISYHSTIGETRPLQSGDHIIRNFQQNVPLKIYPYNMNKILNHLC